MSNMCLVVTPSIRTLADKIRQEYPEASTRNGFSDQMCAEWIGLYNNINSKNPDFVPSMKSLVNFIEKLRNKEGKSFLRDLKAEERQRAIEQEMQDIKAKAIADGTFMKAPNGKPTNLTERQWLQVRTKAFKAWFGDWERVANFDVAINKRNITNKEYAFNGEDFVNKLIEDKQWSKIAVALKKKLSNLADIKFYYADINYSTNGIYGSDNIIYLDRNRRALSFELHEFIHAITSLEYRKNPEFKKQVDELYTVAINDSLWGKKALHNSVFNSQDIYGYNDPEEFLAEAFSNRAFANILERIPYDGKKSVWQEFINILKNLFKIDRENTVFDAVINSIFEYSKVNDSIRKDVSKVVDENGEPLVVYRTNSRAFDGTFEKGDVYFSSDAEYTKPYARGSKDANSVAVFLNIKTPLDNRLTNYTNYGRQATLLRTGEVVNTEDYEIENKNVAKWREEGLLYNKDGIIGNDRKNYQAEINGEKAISDGIEYVVENSNQIKSATDNNGEFSIENDSILASPAQYEEIPVELMEEMADEEAAITAYDLRESSDPDLNKKFGDKTEVSVSEMLNNLLASNTPFEEFVKALQENIGELGDIRIQLVSNSNSKVYGIAGSYSSLDNTIYINRNASFQGKNGKVDYTIIHELVHAIVANSLNTQKHREELGKIFDEAREKIFKKYGVNSFEELPEYLRKGRLYGLQNLDEFSAEFFTNSEFILELNDENTFGKRSSKKSLFNRLIEWIKSLLPKGVTSIYKRSGEILEDILLNSGGNIQANRNLFASNNNAANNQQASTIDPRFKQGIETLTGYYEGGGRLITDDFPGVPNELDDKLNNHFMGGEELSDEDYYELSKYISVVKNTDANTSQGWPYIAVPKQQSVQQQSQSDTSNSKITSAIKTHSGYWTRQEAQNNPRILYVFTDNTDRDSGSGIIPDDSWYSKKYGKGHHFPTMTAAVVRGLDNSRPISTQRWYHQGAKGVTGRWTDADVEEFEKIIRAELQDIVEEFNTGKYETIMFPEGDGLFNTSISNISKTRTPKLYQALANALHDFGFDSLIPADAQSSNSSPSQAASLASSAAGAVSIGDVTPEQQAEAQRRYEEANASKPKPVRPQSDSFKTALKVTENRTTQFYQTFTPQQIKDRGVMIADYFSDILDDYILDELDRVNEIINNPDAPNDEKEEARTLKNLLRDLVNGRQYAANKIQIGTILDQIKDKIRRNVNSHDGVEKQLWQNTLDFFDELFNNQASLEIEEQEGIRIIGLKTIEKSPDDIATEEQNDGNDETGHIVSGNDGWIFQAKFEDPAASLSKRVRRMTYNIKRPNADKDDLGHVRKYPSGQIYATLLSYLAKTMQNPDDFMQIIKPEDYDGIYDHYGNEVTEELYPYGYPTFPVLETMRSQYPWVEQIINRLTDDYLDKDWNTCIAYPSTYGAMASQFYTNFRKVFIPYAKIQVGDGKFGVTPLNTEMEARCQKDKLAANFNNGIVMTDTCIYNQDTTINREHADDLKDYIHDVIDDGGIEHAYRLYQDLSDPDSDTSEEDIEEFNMFLDRTVFLLNSFGISSNRENVVALLAQSEQGSTLLDMMKDLHYIADVVSKVSDENAKSFNYLLDLQYVGGEPLWGRFFEGRGMITDESYMQSFYDSASKKTRYSYSADNYLQKTFRGLYNPDIDERRAFIDEHYKKYEWFYNHKTNTWRNKWLEHLYDAQDISDVLPYRNINNITEYGETTKVRDYSKWDPSDVWLVQNRSFDGTKPYTFYLAPIFSDSPMSMTVKGPVLNNTEVLDALVGLVDQELWRIKYVGERGAAIERGEIKPIANYDGKRGKEFCFIPELNDFTFENGETFLQAITRMKEGRAEDGSDAVYIKEDIENVEKQAILAIMSQKADAYLDENRSQYNFENFDYNEFLGNYMNMVYANASIIQLTTIDLAFYKDATDFQKRFKEVYAGGIQLNTNSRFGKKTENVALLADDIITSPSYAVIADITNKNPNLTDKDKESILKTFTNINVADAQAIRAMHSFRSVMDMMGRWDERAQEALEHFEKGEWNREDFDVVYQTIKPFVYAVIDRNDGMGGVIPVPQQHKNSEICALMMYNLITNNLNSPVYRALSRFMETKGSDGEYLVDMIQFESAGKVGNQGVVNINYNPNKVIEALENEEYDFIPDAPNTLENVDTNYKAIKKQMDKRLADKKISQEDYNKIMQSLRPSEDEIVDMLNQAVLVTNEDGSKTINPEVVHTIPFDNYYQAQPTPEHHIDAEATFGSQGRNIAPADLPDNFELTLKVKGKNKTITLKGRDKVIDFYYELLDENLIEDFFGDGKRKGGLKEIFASKENLLEAITEIVRGNPKYGKDFVEALKLDSDGNFTISPNSPTMFTLMQELVTSLFKNRITKQKINGAALIQAAGIGLDENLRLVKDGKGNIVGAQCLMPITSKEFFEPFIEEREINGRKEMVLNPDKLAEAGLDKAVGYRIPTENKSSMLPLIITGFTPLQNGSVIILPAEITALAGSDFDVDKMFIMLSEFYIQKYDMKAAREAWAEENSVTTYVFLNPDLEDNISDEDPEEFREWFKKNKETYRHEKPQVKRVEYDWSKSPKENGRKARNNMIIQIIYGILTSEAGNQSLLNPQGFDNAKAAAKLHRIISDPTLKQQLLKNYASGITAAVPSADQIRTMFLDAYKDMDPATLASLRQSVNAMSDEDVVNAYIEKVALENDDVIDVLLKSSLEEREDFIKKYSVQESPIYPQTFAHSHARNMAGSNQIGIYAIQGSMAAKYQRAHITLKTNQQFVVNGRTLKDVDVSENGKRLKRVGEMIGASADNGKDPILSDAGSTMKTAPIIGYMLRLGLTHEEAVLIINQPFMKDVNYNPDKVDRAVKKMPVGDVSTKTLVKSILNPYSLTPMEQMNIMAMCYRILEQAKAMEGLTMISRADSPNGAMQNSFAKARVQQYMVELFNAQMQQQGFPFFPIKEVINNHTIKVSEGEDAVREKLKAQPMAFLHAMYGLGINSLNDLASPYFFMLKKEFDGAIVKPILYNQSDTNKEHLENLVDDLYLEYITYALSVSPLFGEEQNEDGTHASMKSKRDYYLNSFADDFAKILQENKAIREQLGSILQRDGNRVVLKDVGSLAKGQKDAISRRFDALIALGEEGQKLAKDLLLYAYYDSGLNFTHDSFSSRLSTYFLSQFPVFRDMLQHLDTPLTKEQQQNFIHQFLITHKNAAYSVDSIINRETNVSGDVISVDMNDFKMNRKFVNTILSPDPKMTGVQPYPYISFDGHVYELDADAYDMNPAVAIYHRLEDYPTGDYRPIYNANKSLSQLAEEYSQTETEQRPEEPSIDEDTHPDIAHNTGDDNPAIDNSGDEFDYDVPDFDDFSGIDDMQAPKPYNDQDTLQDPMCTNKK